MEFVLAMAVIVAAQIIGWIIGWIIGLGLWLITKRWLYERR